MNDLNKLNRIDALIGPNVLDNITRCKNNHIYQWTFHETKNHKCHLVAEKFQVFLLPQYQ